MIFDIITAFGCGGAGLCLGWVMHALHRSGALQVSSPAVQNPAASKTPKQTTASQPKKASDAIPQAKLTEVADRIRSFAARIAASVDAHQSRVDRVSTTLHASDLSGAPPVILEAVEELLSANEMMRDQLQSSQEQLREQSKQLQSAEQRAHTDVLTQLSNRGAFDERLERQYSKGASRAGTLVLLDIDFFKAFNDDHGHRFGDEVLRQVARMLEVRLEPYGLVSRFGGEEFSVLIDDTDFADVIDLIEKTRSAIGSREIRFEEKRERVSLSVGFGQIQPGQTKDEWLQNVDDALYHSKESGRDCSHYVVDRKFIRVVTKKSPRTIQSASTSLASPGEPPTGTESGIQSEIELISKQVNGAIASDLTVNRPNAKVSPNAKTTSTANARSNNEGTSQSDSIDSFTNSLSKIQATDPPKALSYLPDRETMIDGISETIETSNTTTRPHHLMAVTLSGQPGGAIMRSLLQLVRAATRSQDRIGCLNHSTLLVCLPECDHEETRRRAEQVCSAAGSIGVPLASPDKTGQGERLSIGVLELTREQGIQWDNDLVDQAITQSQAVAFMASRQTEPGSKLPINLRQFKTGVAPDLLDALP